MQALKKNLDDAKGLWVEKLYEILWTYKTPYKSKTKETLFQLEFGKEVMISVEISLPNFKMVNYDHNINNQQLKMSLDLIKKVRDEAMVKKEN